MAVDTVIAVVHAPHGPCVPRVSGKRPDNVSMTHIENEFVVFILHARAVLPSFFSFLSISSIPLRRFVAVIFKFNSMRCN